MSGLAFPESPRWHDDHPMPAVFLVRGLGARADTARAGWGSRAPQPYEARAADRSVVREHRQVERTGGGHDQPVGRVTVKGAREVEQLLRNGGRDVEQLDGLRRCRHIDPLVEPLAQPDAPQLDQERHLPQRNGAERGSLRVRICVESGTYLSVLTRRATRTTRGCRAAAEP